MTARAIERQPAGDGLVLVFRQEFQMRPARAALLATWAARGADQRGLWVPFRDKSLRERDRDIDGLVLLRIEIDHRRLHPLPRNHGALSQKHGTLAAYPRMCPIIDELWQLRSLQW